MERYIVNGSNRFHPAIEIPWHPIRGPEVELVVATVREVKQPGVLEEPADDADDSDAVAHAADTRTETADAAHDQVDFHACLRRGVKGFDCLPVDQRIHLGDDPRVLSLARIRRFPFDHLYEPKAHVGRRNEELAIESLPRKSSQGIE